MHQLLILLAGLAFFLFGMEQLSTLLTSFTSGNFSEKLNKSTRSDFAKTVTGFIVTSIFQSSSATTAILVSMTSVGLITVADSISFLIGSNVGSVTTAWIVAIKITKAGIYMFTAGLIGKIVFNNRFIKNISLFFLGLGLIFFGLETMSGALLFLKDSPELIEYFSRFDASVSVVSLLILVVFGALFSALIQSSGATAAMVITIAMQGIISIHSGAAIVLGATLGTVVTALMASVGTSAEGRRTAFLQIFINIAQVAIGLIVFYPSVMLVIKLSKMTGYDNPGFMVALYMTLLKLMLFISVFPFRKQIVKLADKAVRKKFRLLTTPLTVSKISSEDSPQDIKENLSPITDLYAKYLTDMLAYGYIGIRKSDFRSLNKKVDRYEEVIDEGHKKIIFTISRCKNPHIEALWLYLKMSDEAESMGDHAKAVAKYGVRLDDKEHAMSPAQKELLLKCYLMVFMQFYEICIKKNYDRSLVAKCEKIERYLRREKRKIYLLLCSEQDHNYEKRLIFGDILSEYSKFNHSVKRILQANIDANEGRGIYLWESRCKTNDI